MAAGLGESTHDLHALDGIDAQIGFQIRVQTDHVRGVTGALGNQRDDRGLRVEGRRGRLNGCGVP